MQTATTPSQLVSVSLQKRPNMPTHLQHYTHGKESALYTRTRRGSPGVQGQKAWPLPAPERAEFRKSRYQADRPLISFLHAGMQRQRKSLFRVGFSVGKAILKSRNNLARILQIVQQ
jgi:hypothetical protein